MKTWSLYDLETGLFIGACFSGSETFLAANLRPGIGAIEGDHDHLSKKVHLPTGEVHEHEPPRPSEDHDWHHESKRWVVKPAVHAAREQRANAIGQIKVLEAAQPRALREAALGHAGAVERLADIESKIASLRQSIS